jgi:trans-2-enoyl-CoA reductase
MKQEEIYHNAQWEAMEARLRMSKHDIQLEAQNQLQQILDAGETDEFKLFSHYGAK